MQATKAAVWVMVVVALGCLVQQAESSVCYPGFCHSRCRNGLLHRGKKFLTGQCQGDTCQCSNSCALAKSQFYWPQGACQDLCDEIWGSISRGGECESENFNLCRCM